MRIIPVESGFEFQILVEGVGIVEFCLVGVYVDRHLLLAILGFKSHSVGIDGIFCIPFLLLGI